jgi:hypothetical protein
MKCSEELIKDKHRTRHVCDPSYLEAKIRRIKV